MLFPCGGVLSERGTLWSLNCGVYSKTDKRQEYLPQSAPTVTNFFLWVILFIVILKFIIDV